MIISHKHKFIFIKPTKVAGTSMEINLAKHCGPEDIITPINAYDPSSDEDRYNHPVQNDTGFYNHITPTAIKEQLAKQGKAEILDEYFTFTIVRNPWDLVVSRYWWEKARYKKPLRSYLGVGRVLRNVMSPSAYKSFFMKAVKRSRSKASQGSFAEFLQQYHEDWKNTQYYFAADGTPICDYYIRYEDLDSGYQEVCEQIGIPYEQLPRTKTKQRSERKHYTEYYTEETQQLVAEMFADEIAYFGYTFTNTH